MPITDRQRKILDSVIEEYVKSAQPISSHLLEKRHGFKICPATIRNEMQQLTDKGFLLQPHTSAGRIPTDKAYRLYVNDLLGKEKFEEEDATKEIKVLGKEIEDSFRFFQSFTRKMAELSSGLAITYFPEEGIVFKEGWHSVLKEPEFEDAKFLSGFIEIAEDWEKNFERLEVTSEIKIYIGRENPFPRAKELSTIVSKHHFPKKKEGTLAILGPKRMAYQKNIDLINSLEKILTDF